MRLRYSDVSWAWLRSAAVYSRLLKTSDVSWSILRTSDVYGRLLRTSDVLTRYAALIRPKDTVISVDRPYTDMIGVHRGYVSGSDFTRFVLVATSKDVVASADALKFEVASLLKDSATVPDKPYFDMRMAPVLDGSSSSDFSYLNMVNPVRETTSSLDAIAYQFSVVLRDETPPSDWQAFSLTFLLRDASSALDKISCTFQAGLQESVTGSDRQFCTVVALLKDSVTAESTFQMLGTAFSDMTDASYTSDAFYHSLQINILPDAVAASDFIEIGVRYIIDFYFGGLSFGGSPFGGRL